MRSIYLIFFISLFSLLFQNCQSEDPTVDQQAQTTEKLSGVWSVVNATIDNENVTSDFSAFTLNINRQLSFTTNSSSITRSPNPWPANGSFTFGGAADSPNLNQLIRNDGLNISININESGDQLVMMFNFTSDNIDSTEGRTAAINGDWVFSFEK